MNYKKIINIKITIDKFSFKMILKNLIKINNVKF